MWQFEVPNAPCGVESLLPRFYRKVSEHVPNAPCGVERDNSIPDVTPYVSRS